MARMARVVVPNYPHHVTQRGNRRQKTFFNDADCTDYLKPMSESCRKAGTEIWAYCGVPNHVLCEASHKTCYVKSPIM